MTSKGGGIFSGHFQKIADLEPRRGGYFLVAAHISNLERIFCGFSAWARAARPAKCLGSLCISDEEFPGNPGTVCTSDEKFPGARSAPGENSGVCARGAKKLVLESAAGEEEIRYFLGLGSTDLEPRRGGIFLETRLSPTS